VSRPAAVAADAAAALAAGCADAVYSIFRYNGRAGAWTADRADDGLAIRSGGTVR